MTDAVEATPWGAVEALEAQARRVETACGPSVRMVWRCWGQGRPVVLLHGGAGSWLHWVRNISALAADRTVWVPDLPGFGESGLPEDVRDADTIAPYVSQGIAVLLQGQAFDLVGFSFGALVAALVAARTETAPKRMVLVSVFAMGLPAKIELKPMRGVTDPAEREAVLRFNLNALMLYDPASIDDLAMAIQGRIAPMERLRSRGLAASDILLRLAKEWRCQAYGIWAQNDVLFRDQLGALEEKISLLGLKETVLLPAAGHWLQYERAAAFDRVLARLLNDPVTGAQR